jgi:rRNA maturation endonuclease Nob1
MLIKLVKKCLDCGTIGPIDSPRCMYCGGQVVNSAPPPEAPPAP